MRFQTAYSFSNLVATKRRYYAKYDYYSYEPDSTSPRSDSQRLPWHFNDWPCNNIGQWHCNGLKLNNKTLKRPSQSNCNGFMTIARPLMATRNYCNGFVKPRKTKEKLLKKPRKTKEKVFKKIFESSHFLATSELCLNLATSP